LRKVELRQGTFSSKSAASNYRGAVSFNAQAIYSLINLREILPGCNQRYLAHPARSTTSPPGLVRSTG
jgi:hypothetical protein